MPEKAKRFQWLKYLFRGLLVLFLLASCFINRSFLELPSWSHSRSRNPRPFRYSLKFMARFFPSLYLEDLHLQPLPENKILPLERVDAKWIALRYNLFSLLKKDFLNVD